MKDDWEVRPLGEVCAVPLTVNPKDRPNDEFRYIDVSAVSNRSFTITAVDTILGREAPGRARRQIRTGDILFATIRPGLQRIAIVPQELDGEVCSTGYCVLRPDPETVSSRFVFYWLLSREFTERISTLQRGASYPAVTDREVRAQTIPVPPLAEQERIVRILDDLLNALDRSKGLTSAASEKALDLLNGFLDSTVESASTQWPVYPLGELADLRNGINYTRSSTGAEVALVGVKDFQDHFQAPQTGLARVRIDGRLGDNDRLQEGDLLCVRSNGNPALIGRCMLVSKVERQTTHSGFTIRIRLRDSRHVVPTWVAWVIRCPRTRQLLVGQGTGTNIRSLNQAALSSIPIPVPPPGEQETIADTLAQMQALTSGLTRSLEARLSALDQLRSSLLDRAFTGEL